MSLLDTKQKKALLAVGVTICLLIAGTKIYSAYRASQPPFEVGECFLISDPRIGDVKFQVVANDRVNRTTDAVGSVEVLPGMELQVPIRATFDDIRNSSAEKTECDK